MHMHIIIARKFIKQNPVELKGEIEKSTVTAGNCNIPPIVTNWISRQKIVRI